VRLVACSTHPAVPREGGVAGRPPGPISSLPFLHSSQMNSDDLLALPARCPLAAGGRVIPPIGAVVMACLAHCRGRGHLWISFASSRLRTMIGAAALLTGH
jgi:hypothetical protein